MLRLRHLIAATALTAVCAVAFAATLAPAGEARTSRDIVQTAVAAGQFKTLTTLVQQAGLAGTLRGSGQLTVFAPTDRAFAKVPKATLDALARDRAKLRSVLLYHVAKGRLTAAKVVKRSSIRTANGQRLRVRVQGSRVVVGGARVTKPNVLASNGVIHVIDTVLLPPTLAAQSLPRTGGPDADLALPLAAGTTLLLLTGIGLRRRSARR